jgi:DtxR family Mn-dependent transcriptional regulator
MINSGKRSRNPISAVMREYLAEIYRLEIYEPAMSWVATTTLAERLGVSPAAVARMVQRLKKRGLVQHELYQGMRLTDLGRREALYYLRQHRLTELLLVEVMGFGWHEVHHEADLLAPAISQRVSERIAELLKNPQRCPHGEPIPSADGYMPALDDQPLLGVQAPATLVISRVNTDEPDKLSYIGQMGLKPGQVLEYLAQEPFGGPLRLRIGDKEHLISAELAEAFLVDDPDKFILEYECDNPKLDVIPSEASPYPRLRPKRPRAAN